MTKFAPILAAIVAAFALTATAFAVDPTPTPTPKLTMTKTALAPEVVPGGLVSYTLAVVNSGFANSDTISLTDVLPGGVHWTMDQREECTLTSTFGQQILTCRFALNKRHLNDSQTDFVNPSFAVTLYGIAGECGETYSNQALATHDGDVLITNPVTIKTTDCPTPTPTPTTAPTQTPQPTPTVVPPTPTPQIVYVEVTPTPKPAPLAPKTGNTGSGVPSEGNGWPWAFVTLGVLGLAGVGFAVYGRKHK